MTKGRVSAQHMTPGERQAPLRVKTPKPPDAKPAASDPDFGQLGFHLYAATEVLRHRANPVGTLEWKPSDWMNPRGRPMLGKTYREIYDRNCKADGVTAGRIREFRAKHAGESIPEQLTALAADPIWDGVRLDAAVACILGDL